MNERLKQLAVQANWWKPLGLPSDWDEGDYVVSPEQMKKFAELIVRECMRMCDVAEVGYMTHGLDIQSQGCQSAKQYIADWFEVEE